MIDHLEVIVSINLVENQIFILIMLKELRLRYDEQHFCVESPSF